MNQNGKNYLAKDTTEIGAARTMPQQTPVLVHLAERTALEPLALTLALDTEDGFDRVLVSMRRTTGLEQVVLKLSVLVASWVERSHLLHLQPLILPIKRVDVVVGNLLHLHNEGSVLHIAQAFQEFYFFLDHGLIADDGGAVATESMGNQRVECVRKMLNRLRVARAVIRSQGGIVNEGRKVLKRLVTSCDGRFAEFSQRQLLSVVIQRGHGVIEVLRVEDELHERLHRRVKRRLGWLFVFILVVLGRLAGSLVVIVVRIIIVISLNKSVFARLGVFSSIFPSEARFVLELLFKLPNSIIRRPDDDIALLTTFSNSAPSLPEYPAGILRVN